MNLEHIPLEDAFETTLSQAWAWGLWTVDVNATPTFTFPSWVKTYIVANPKNSKIQIAEIDAYNPSTKTLNVSDITLEKWAWVNSTAQDHPVGSTIIISDNYEFWKGMRAAINSKLDNDADWVWDNATDFGWLVSKSLTTAQRTALTATNGMIVYDTTAWVHYQYIWWAWGTFATWTTPNASETVAGKVELPTDAEVTSKTVTWWTGATLTPTNAQIGKSVWLKAVDANLDETDHLVFDNAWTDNKILISVFRNALAWSKTIKGTFEMLTDAEAFTWTDETRVPNIKQIKDNYVNKSQILSAWTLTFDDVAQTDITINHNLGVIPKKMDFIFHNTSYNRVWHRADNDWTITSFAYVNNAGKARTVTTNEAIACFDDWNNSNWERRVSSVSATQVVLSYTIVFDWGSWVATTDSPYVILTS